MHDTRTGHSAHLLRKAFIGLFVIVAAAGMAAANLRGVVVDAATGDPLAEASIRLLRGRDSSFVKGAAADLDGVYRLTDVARGRYIVEASYVGYQKGYTTVRVGDSDVKVDTIRLAESSYMLRETTVVGVKTPIKVMQDTVEFNADSYKTPPNAVVEDLLKRLPGVEVGSDGKISANGKEVKKILVDGKEFFSDDPKVASKNLPVNMVDKLQVVDRKSDLARLTGVDDGEDETVINLTVKKGMQNGWFGNVEAGYGTDSRYLTNFNVNRFVDGNQFTLLGNANNTNSLGFTDGNSGRFRRFGGSNGITESQSVGLNFNVGRGELLRVGGDVMYSHSDNDTRKRQSRLYLYPDYTNDEESHSLARDRGHNLRADFRMEWKPDSFNTVDFRPNFSFNRNDSWSFSTDTLYNGTRGADLINRSLNRSNSDGTSWEFGGRLIYNHNFRSRRGRSFSLSADYRFSNVTEDELTYSHNIFYRLLLANPDDPGAVDTYDQYADNHTWSNSVNARLSWTEPIGNVANGRFLTFGYTLQYRWNNADKYVFSHPVSYPGMDYDNPVVDYGSSEREDDLSNSFRNDFMTQNLQVGFKQVRSAYTLDLGVAAVPSMSRSHDLINSARDIATRWVWNFSPYLRFRYKMGKQRSMNAHYRGSASQPSISQLQPVADRSNPLAVVVGNPNLDPSFTHSLRLRFQDFNADSQRSIMLMMGASLTQNSIVGYTQLDPSTGARETHYRNVNGVWNVDLFNVFSMPLRNKLWSINNSIFARADRRVAFNNDERNRSTALNFSETFSIAYRPQSLEFEVRPTYSLQSTLNSSDNLKTTTVHNYGGSFVATWYTPIGLVLSSDLRYTASAGYSDGFNTDQWMWNASLSYQFLREKQATIAIKAYDLLQQQQNVSRSVTASYIDDTEYNSLMRYFTISFSYRFNSFGKGNEPASRNQRRGPMGPPPGGSAGGPPPRF